MGKREWPVVPAHPPSDLVTHAIALGAQLQETKNHVQTRVDLNTENPRIHPLLVRKVSAGVMKGLQEAQSRMDAHEQIDITHIAQIIVESIHREAGLTASRIIPQTHFSNINISYQAL